jgi:hypothetical protein
MKRLLCLTAVAALLAAPMAHNLFAKPKAKVAICHVTDDGDNHHVIVVSSSAEAAHLAHGDCLIVVAAGDDAPKAGTPCCPTRGTDPLGVELTTCADPANVEGCTFGTTP